MSQKPSASARHPRPDGVGDRRNSQPVFWPDLLQEPSDEAERQAIRMAQSSIDGYSVGDSPGSMTGEETSDDAELESLAAAMDLLGSLSGKSLFERAEEAVAPLRIGRYEVIGERGRGGFGIVLHAVDVMLQRDVALKIPKPERLLAGQSLDELVREARMVAKLSHPGIVRVHEVRRWGPVWYIASDYCAGPTLAEWLESRNGALSLRTIVETVAATADAVHYAHTRGVLHLDLKPDNILLDIGKEAALRPMVTDFGLSHVDDAKFGIQEKIGGTLTYMAPEQKARDAERIGVATDIYALGIILTELIDASYGSARGGRQAAGEWLAISPSSMPRDLRAICQRCLANDPTERYPSAQSFSLDLRRYLNGETVDARPLSWPGIAAYYCRRKPLVSTMLFALLTTLVASYALIVAAWRESSSHLALLTIAEQRQRESASRMEKSLLSLASFAQEAKLRMAYANDDAGVIFPSRREFFSEAQGWADAQSDGSAPTQGVRAAIKSMSLIDDLAESDETTRVEQYHAGVSAWLELMREHPEEERWRRALALHLFTYNLREADGQWLSWRSSQFIADESVRRQLEVPYALLLIDYARARSRHLNASVRYGMLSSALEILDDERCLLAVDEQQWLYWRLTTCQQAAAAATECWKAETARKHFALADRIADKAPPPADCNAQLAALIADVVINQWGRAKKPVDDEALARMRRAVSYGERAVAAAPNNWLHLVALVQHYRYLANVHRRNGRGEACLEALNAAAAFLDLGVARCGHIRQLLSERAKLLTVIADEHLLYGDSTTARPLLERAVADFAAVEMTSLDPKATWVVYGRALLSLTKVYAKENRSQESHEAFESLVRVTTQMRGFTRHPQMQNFVRQAEQVISVNLNDQGSIPPSL